MPLVSVLVIQALHPFAFFSFMTDVIVALMTEVILVMANHPALN